MSAAAGLTKAQKEQVTQVRDVTSCSDAQAVQVLRSSSWQVDVACDRFFHSGMQPEKSSTASSSSSSSSSSSPAPGSSKKAAKAEAEFRRFEDKDEPGKMNGDKIEAFARELGLDPFADPTILYVLWHMEPKKGGQVSKDEFVQGMVKMDCESLAQLKAKLDSLRGKLRGDGAFASFWGWVYGFNCEDGQRSISIDLVRGLTQMLLSKERWPLVGEWCDFLAQIGPKGAVTKDTWVLVLDFARRVRPDLSNYDAEQDAWPVIFDEFIEWLGKKRGAK